jgi:hypothetical protein
MAALGRGLRKPLSAQTHPHQAQQACAEQEQAGRLGRGHAGHVKHRLGDRGEKSGGWGKRIDVGKIGIRLEDVANRYGGCRRGDRVQWDLPPERASTSFVSKRSGKHQLVCARPQIQARKQHGR